MSDLTQTTVLLEVEEPVPDDEDRLTDHALASARRLFEQFQDFNMYYFSVEIDEDTEEPVVPLDSEAGRAKLDTQLTRTKEMRARAVERILSKVDEDTTAEELASDYDVFKAAHRFGSFHHPDAACLHDATNWSFGSPILNQKRVEEIKDWEGDGKLYLVDVVARY